MGKQPPSAICLALAGSPAGFPVVRLLRRIFLRLVLFEGGAIEPGLEPGRTGDAENEEPGKGLVGGPVDGQQGQDADDQHSDCPGQIAYGNQDGVVDISPHAVVCKVAK